MRIIVFALTLAMLAVVPAAAQDWERYYSEAGTLSADMRVLVLDSSVPRGEEGRYVHVSLAELLAGLGVFDARYVAVAPGSGDVAPAFTAEDMLAGASGVGIAQGIKAPAPEGDGRAWVAVAAPATAVIPHISLGSVNGADHTGQFVRQATDVRIDGRGYAVLAGNYSAARVRTGYVFFDAAATLP